MSYDDPLPWASIPAVARWAARTFGPAEAVIDADRRVSWSDLGRLVDGAAAAFVAGGLEPGDRVGLWAPNGLEWVVAMLGLQSAGGVVVPLSTRYKGAEAAYILNRSRARVLVSAGRFLGTDYPGMLASQRLPHLERRLQLGEGPVPDGWESWGDFLGVAEGRADLANEVARRVESLTSEDLSDLGFTSGTTGAPKGVMTTHGQSLRVFREWRDIVGLEPGDRYLIVNPMSHTFGYKAGIVASLMTGTTMIPLPAFDVDAVVATVAEERVTVLPGPPTLYQSLLDRRGAAAADLSSLRLAVTGAAVIPTELVRRMRDELGFDTVLTAYGLTESSGCVTACRRGDSIETIAATSGRAFTGVEVMVVDDTGAEVSRGEPGEILCRGYNVMKGYFEDPEATAAAIDAQGWLHTGDIGTMDEAGNLRITDRKKDMFIVGGFNAYPAEIENHLLRHPGVAQVAVIGVPDERLGEVGVAFVVPRSDSELEPGEVVAWARAEMANYKVPRRVVLMDSLPMNAGGKVMKHELRDRAGSA